MRVKGDKLEWNNLRQGKVLKAIAKRHEYKLNNTQQKINDEIRADMEDWAAGFKAIKAHSMDAWRRSFLTEVYAGVKYANTAYARFGHIASPECTFCRNERQNLVHLLVLCPSVIALQNQISNNWNQQQSKKDWFFGNQEDRHTAFVQREMLVYIHKRNWQKKSLNKYDFKNFLLAQEAVEAEIAKKRNNLFDHLEKWATIESLVQ